MGKQRNEIATAFLLTATAFMVLTLILYRPASDTIKEELTDDEVITVSDTEVDEPEDWYDSKDFIGHSFVSANFNCSKPIIEVGGENNEEEILKLKAVLEERIGTDIQVFLVDGEQVIAIYE